jgi:serine/threonine protein kinase
MDDEYTFVKLVGCGSFGKVTLVERNTDRHQFACKEISYKHMSMPEKGRVVDEINLLRKIWCLYVLQYVNRVIDKEAAKVYILTEYCSNGDLQDLIKRHRSARSYIKEKYVQKYLSQLVSALQACHTWKDKSGCVHPILHRDIKPANVFLDSAGDIRLGDFGLACQLDYKTASTDTYIGTPNAMSPNRISQLPYGLPSDVWSLGCVAYELVSLRHPFEADNHSSLVLKISRGRFPRIPCRYSDAMQVLVENALCIHTLKRESADQLGQRVKNFDKNSGEQQNSDSVID